jgi:hypothetical protein
LLDVEEFLNFYKPRTFVQRVFGIGIPKLIYKGKELKLDYAPEPSDIFWDNLHVSDLSKFMRRSLSNIVTLLILLGSSGVILYASYWQVSYTRCQP